MKIAIAMMTTLALTACATGAHYSAPRSAAPASTSPDPFGRANGPTTGIFTDQAVTGKPGQQ